MTSLQTEPDQMHPAQTEIPAARPGALRVLLLAAMFCIGLFGTAAVLNSLLPFRDVPVVKSKFDWLAQHGDEYDTFFIGTSRTYCQILPELFDKLMAEAGVPTHSFNLGVNGMRSPEDTYVLEKALAHRKAPLKLVLVEANAVHVNIGGDENQGSLRAVYWHDWKRFLTICRCIGETTVSGQRPHSLKTYIWKFNAIQHNLNLYLNNTLGIGSGLEWLEKRMGKPGKDPMQELGKRADGYARYDTPIDVMNEKDWKTMEKKLVKANSKPAKPNYKDKASQKELQIKCRLIESFGGKVVTFIPPVAGISTFAPNPAVHPNLPLLNFADTAAYPELFLRENRADVGHLNQPGSEIFTRKLAERVLSVQGIRK